MSGVVSLQVLSYQNSLGHQIAAFLDSMEHIRGVSQTTLNRHRVFTNEFMLLHGDISVTSLAPRQIEEYIKACRQKGNQPRTLHSKQISLAAFFDYLVRKRVITENPCDQVDKVKVPPPEPCVFTRAQMEVLLSLPDVRREIGLRDWSLMTFLFGTGCRIGETLHLQLTDIDFAANKVMLRREITKNGRSRTIPLLPMVKDALRKYLARREAVGNLGDPHLFVTTRPKKGATCGGSVTRSAIDLRLKEYVQKSGMKWNTRVSPHTFRHTFATQWIINGGDTESLMKILGHRNQQMLAFYVSLAIDDLQDKNDLFNPLNNVSKARVNELRTLATKLMKPTMLDEPVKPLPKGAAKLAFDAKKISRMWDED